MRCGAVRRCPFVSRLRWTQAKQRCSRGNNTPQNIRAYQHRYNINKLAEVHPATTSTTSMTTKLATIHAEIAQASCTHATRSTGSRKAKKSCCCARRRMMSLLRRETGTHQVRLLRPAKMLHYHVTRLTTQIYIRRFSLHRSKNNRPEVHATQARTRGYLRMYAKVIPAVHTPPFSYAENPTQTSRRTCAPRGCCISLGIGAHNNQLRSSHRRHKTTSGCTHRRCDNTAQQHNKKRNSNGNSSVGVRAKWEVPYSMHARRGKAAHKVTRADKTKPTPHIAIWVKSTIEPSVASMLIPATPKPTPVTLSSPVLTPAPAADPPLASAAGRPDSPAEAGPFA